MARNVNGLFGGNGAADDEDPVASLFKADKTMPAPRISDNPSAAEVSRWRATTQSSLFDNEVKDPPPGDDLAPPQATVRKLQPTPIGDPQAFAEAPTMMGMTAPEPAGGPPEPLRDTPPRATTGSSQKAAPPLAIVVPDDLPAPPPAAGRPKASATGAKKKRPPPIAADAGTAKAVERDRSRRKNATQRKRNLMLGGLAGLATLAAGAVVLLLGLLPNPLARDSIARIDPAQAAPAAKAAPRKPPAPAKPAAARETPPPAKPEPKAALAAAEPAAQMEKASAERAKPAEPQPKPAAKAREAEPAGAQAQQRPSEEVLDARRAVIVARHKLAEDDAEAAEALMRRVLDDDPSDHHAMDVLARALIDQDRGKEAVDYARRAVERRKRRARYRVVLGDALLMTGDQAGARAEWQIALKLEPNSKSIKQRLGL